jgi:hypothetical protein
VQQGKRTLEGMLRGKVRAGQGKGRERRSNSASAALLHLTYATGQAGRFIYALKILSCVR